MAHDFFNNEAAFNEVPVYTYRKYQYETNDCRGLMDYVDDGVGWSKCSARDFSRYITKGGRRKPCLAGKNSNKFNINFLKIIKYMFAY